MAGKRDGQAARRRGSQSTGRAGRAPAIPAATLADLYDPLAMPPTLAKAHAELDRVVDLCYRPEKFGTDRQRVEFLFALYEKLTAPLLRTPPKRLRTVKSQECRETT